MQPSNLLWRTSERILAVLLLALVQCFCVVLFLGVYLLGFVRDLSQSRRPTQPPPTE